jgi:hypothetical protein
MGNGEDQHSNPPKGARTSNTVPYRLTLNNVWSL